MHHLREIVKITEWGLKGDPARVAAYLNQLIEKLSQEDDIKAMRRLKDLLEQPASSLTTSAIGGQYRLPVDGESRLAIADEEKLNTNDYPIVLDSHTKARVEEFITFMKSASELEAHGVGFSPSLITYGPPGTGKTQLVHFIAGRLGMPLITARSDTLISSFLGSTSKNLRNLFDHISQRHCILFLDEIDAFAKLRDDNQELGELKRVVVSLLQNIDAMNQHTVLLAATNHEHLLDPAIWRRFAFKIPLKIPGANERNDLLKLFFYKYHKQLDQNLFIALSETMTGSDIESLALDAIRDAVIKKQKKIDTDRLIWRFIEFRLKQEIAMDEPTPQILQAIKALNPPYFTGLKLSEMYRISPSTISRRLAKKDISNE